MDKEITLITMILVVIGVLIVSDGNKINKINQEIDKLDFKIQMLETNNEINAKLIWNSNVKIKEIIGTIEKGEACKQYQPRA